MENIELKDIIELAKNRDRISISYIQRNFSIGFVKASHYFNDLVNAGFIEKDGKIIKKSRKKGLKIIFLDVDGVLNSHSTKDLCGPYRGIEDSKVNLLKKLVDASKAKIVLVSTWKEYWYKSVRLKDKQDDLAIYLDIKLSQQGLKISDKTDDYILNRGEGILDYIDRLHNRGIEVDKYVIFDDEMFDYKETKLTKHLIQTSFYDNGLEQKHILRAIKMLNES